jgi:cysteine-rich repeat protein
MIRILSSYKKGASIMCIREIRSGSPVFLLAALALVASTFVSLESAGAATLGFADVVLEFFDSGAGPLPGPYGGTDPGGPGYPIPVSLDVVLGDDPGPTGFRDFLSLPTGSFVTVGFTDETVIDGDGNDIFIQEIGGNGERADVFVSADGISFTFLGIARDNVTTSFDLASIGFTDPVVAVKIVGLDSLGGSPGFDVVNVQVLPGSIGPRPPELGPELAFNLLGELHTLTATVKDSLNNPVQDIDVNFDVVSGPNGGVGGIDSTDVNGEAVFSYVGDGGVGVDRILASFTDDQGTIFNSLFALKFWDQDCQLPNGNGIADTCDIDCAGFEGDCEVFEGCGGSLDVDLDGIPDECSPVCGNGVVEAGEECDPPGLPDCSAGQTCENCLCVGQCDECVYSQGYWKNHNRFGKNLSLQIPWPIDEETMLCDETWLDILKTPPSRGNVFYILGHQWIAAELNVASGAGTTPDVDDALAEAEAMLIECEILDGDRQEALALASLLDDYNNGLIGPPKCDFCGDGEVQEDDGEECDDGNNDDGDGCSCECALQSVALCGHIAEPAGRPFALLLYLLPVVAIFLHKKILC